ncbi:MAG TPA: alkaline phosphatase family protein [Zoogloea sp.]|uniref:alkaline phosphatase family protein n=1 Tax=Zoogloea sp. TaxID=49181 RepID=UPI002BAF0014|nr:alkaline phosphatase family protein [Zoogloea sp.]HMV18023.1 alkaline phosphatase family protein [Rhodocyclaceae bacterium]HNA67841.1 alkaline phosphatase family protein [Rhodocyclaceae bacterium]HNB65127.1 alkaline phosphatase family protein [Rhodocyclaceae bacterium]HNC80482.1 alkaline phosphatase family protein [Rhodocyclaceae bacterium]HNE15630.1 alkaline phosphatase family protein [Rhodocyclaceae bacterium]
MNASRKVLLVGWDAADWKIINGLVDRGLMPHTASLIERGVMGNLATLHPVLSPMLWTTIATGKRPFKHGVLGFTEPSPDGSGVQPVSQWSRKTKALWNILNQSGLKSHVIGWWPSHPVEPINGVMVSNHYHTALGPPDQPWPLAPGMVHPPRAQQALADVRLNPNELLPEQVCFFVPRAAEIDQDKDRRLASVMKTLAECTSVHAAATWAMANEPWDFMGVYYDAIDHFSHGFMRYHPPRRPFVPERDFELYRHVVEAAYQFHDLMLGTLLQLAPPDTTVIICSDHGFHSDHRRPAQIPNEPAGPAVEHRDLGMFLIAGPGIRRDHLIHGASVLDVTPTVLTLFGLPVGEDMDGKVLLDVFDRTPEVAHVPSWDAVPGDDARLSGEQQFDPLAAKEVMDQLVALGYIEKLDDNREQAVAQTVRELRYNLARSYMDAGRMLDAAPLLQELYAAEPDQYRFGVHLALCYRALNRVAELRPLVERMTRDRQEAAQTARAALQALCDTVRQRQQAVATTTAVRAQDDPPSAADALASIDLSQLTEDERSQVDELRFKAWFSTSDLDYLMGWVLGAEGRHDEALAHLLKAERADPGRPGLLVQIGEAHLAVHRWDEAEAAFRRALAADALSPYAHLGVARALLPRRARAEEAVEAALDSIRLLYQNPLAHYVLGLGLLRLRQFFMAADAMRTALALNPNFVRAHRVLARFYRLGTGEHDKARAHLEAIQHIRLGKRAASMTGQPGLGEAESLAHEVDDEAGRPGLHADAVFAVRKTPDDPAEFVTVVAGLPRSGTSMMMQMLAAGGLPILTDNKREADLDNPRGYFELEAATRLRTDRTWFREGRGQAVKIVAQLLPYLPGDVPCRVIFMERDLDEVLKSQTVMLDNLGREGARLSDAQVQASYRQQLRRVKLWLARQSQVDVLFVRHRDALADPAAVAEQVNAFLGGRLDCLAMATCVDASLYRQRATA